MKKKLIIVGLSNNAKLAKFYFEKDTDYEIIGFAVHEKFLSTEFCGKPVFPIEKIEKSHPPEEFDTFIATGYSNMNSVRESLYHEFKNLGYFLPNYISPKCTFLTEENIGDNNFILEDNTIQPFVVLGSNNVLWSGNHIGHDVKIGDHNFITSHVVVSGFTTIGNNCFLGVNSSLRDDITIANKTLVAAGAAIMKDTVECGVYLGPKTTQLERLSTEIDI